MLTLQQLLESDSIASLVAKLNANFQTVSNSNGGPQGIRGGQGIPGLPGRMGPTGSIGVTGATGTILGIIPFAGYDGLGASGVGPTAGQVAPNGQSVSPWPQASWSWLMYYYGAGVSPTAFPPGVTAAFAGFSGVTAKNGDIFIDHSNSGYWKYLTQVDIEGAAASSSQPFPGGYTSGGYYRTDVTATVTYPRLITSAGWAGSGWYFYPAVTPTIPNTNVWVNDYSTYLIGTTAGPYSKGPFSESDTSPLKIANARLVTKYGTVWITSGSDGLTSGVQGDDTFDTEDIGKEFPKTRAASNSSPGQLNSGVDRLLFKMSVDGLPYLSNISARGYSGTTGQAAILANTSFPSVTGGTQQMSTARYWVKPQYNANLSSYTPLLFLSEREPSTSAIADGVFSSLALYMHTAKTDSGLAENKHKSLFVWSSRSAFSPTNMFPVTGTTGAGAIGSTSTVNYGEFVMDTRRLIASNQYVCSLPVDMKLSSDHVSGASGSLAAVYREGGVTGATAGSTKFRAYQGYISSVNGKALTGEEAFADLWEYGLGNTATYGITGGTHDTSSGTAGMQTRRSWYGSAVLDTLPSAWEGSNPGAGDYIRIAGMMERGRRFSQGSTAGSETHFLSELIFYSSHFKNALGSKKGVTNTEVDPTINAHKSLPSLYVSPYRNIGIGTFVGGTTALNDMGPLEPAGHLHVHAKQQAREDDPTFTFKTLASVTSRPNKVFSVAAFSGEGLGTVSDVLFGTLATNDYEYVNPTQEVSTFLVNSMEGNTGLYNNKLRNAIRSESWMSSYLNTMHLGAQPFSGATTIGKHSVASYSSEFQLSFHPLTPNATNLETGLTAISGLGFHTLYPRNRAHFFGKNAVNETEQGLEAVGATAGLTGGYPYYTAAANNTPSTNQITLDYIGSSYTYPVGIYDYQYYAYGATAGPGSTGRTSPNSAAYPNREIFNPTRHAVPYGTTANNLSYPSTNAEIKFNDAYRHGNVNNAWFEPTSYIGFNLYRDLSSGGGNTAGGDSKDSTRWILGTNTSADGKDGNNGGAALISSPHGELGIVTIPRGRDGGNPYEQFEQRGLGTRDVLNQMKIVFDKYGNIAIGNAAGWDLDAYPSLLVNPSTGYLNYLSFTNRTTTGPFIGETAAMSGSGYTAGYSLAGYRYGNLSYRDTGDTETGSLSPAATINSRVTSSEYIRLEIAAEKAWSRDGRMVQKVGYGYPPNATLVISNVANYILLSAADIASGITITSWSLITDAEGRIVNNVAIASPTKTTGAFQAIVFPHPRDFSTGGSLAAASGVPAGFIAPSGAMAAEWWGASTDTPYTAVGITGTYIESGVNNTFFPTTDTRGSANVRLNNYVYGEGFGFSGPRGQTSGGGSLGTGYTSVGDYTQQLVKQKRQESPKLILSFLETDPSNAEATRRDGTDGGGVGPGADPYKKVTTVIQSAQNESALREYWIPKTDNTGGTFMVFTDHMGSKEKDSGFDTQLTDGTNIEKLIVYQVVTQEILYGYTGPGGIAAGASAFIGITGAGTMIPRLSTTKPMGMGYVNYFNRGMSSGTNTVTPYFPSLSGGTAFGQLCMVAPYISSFYHGITGLTALAFGVTDGGLSPKPIVDYQPFPSDNAANPLGLSAVGLFGSIRRNVDKYYSIYDNNGTSKSSNSSEIRYKRINSEYVLFDFNVTLEVMNPSLGTAASGFGGFSGSDSVSQSAVDNSLQEYIDLKSPRMTQYVSFIYNPDKEVDATENLYGNGPWFSSWSTYRNWSAGSAVVGATANSANSNSDFRVGVPKPPTGIDSPFFIDIARASTSASQLARTWTGNFLDVGMWRNLGSARPAHLDPILGMGNTGAGPYNGISNPLRSAFSTNIFNSFIGQSLLAVTASDGSYLIDGYSFASRFAEFYSTWGNQTMNRIRPMMWRVNPTRYTTVDTGNTNNNAFLLEVQFETPIMHTDHAFSAQMFQSGQTGTSYYPYKFLTLSGQSIIKYADQ